MEVIILIVVALGALGLGYWLLFGGDD